MATIPWIIESLKSTGFEFKERHHPEVLTTSQVAEKEKLPLEEVAKVVVVFICNEPTALVLPANRKVELHAIQRIAGTNKVRLATETEMQKFFPDCEVGAIPPLNHWKNIPFWMDKHMENSTGEIVFQAGTHEDAIQMNFHDWFKMVRPKVEQFAVHRRPMAGDIDEDEEIAKGGRWADVG